MTSFDAYYQPCEPGTGLLVNGQYYRTRHGKETLQMMVNDGVFGFRDETPECEREGGSDDDDCMECKVHEETIENLNMQLSNLTAAWDQNDFQGTVELLNKLIEL